jgi:hypothetical protein
LIDTPTGGHVPIGQVADVQIVPNPTVIRHESVATYLDVTADVAGRDVRDVARDIDGLVDRVEFPLEHHAELLGGYEERLADRAQLIGVLVAAVIAIFLLLQAALRSWRLAILSFATLLLAAAGGLTAVLLTGGTVTLGSIAGLIAVVGIAARAVVLLIRRYQDLERTEGLTFGPELVIRGTRESLAPTLIAVLATAIVLVPVAVSGSVSGLEIVQPMAVVVLGGLAATAVLNLLVVPILYLRYGFLPDRDTWADELLAPIPEREPVEVETRTGVLQRIRPAIAALPVVLVLSSCGGTVADKYKIEHEPAAVESIPGSDHARVTLEERAARRLAIQTTAVGKRGNSLVVPSSAVFVDPEGSWWVYTNPKPLVFERQKIALQRQAGGFAFFASGPPAGTRVVTVGVPELSGVEEEIGH